MKLIITKAELEAYGIMQGSCFSTDDNIKEIANEFLMLAEKIKIERNS